MDVVDKKTRSRMMANIKGKNTKPDIIIKKHQAVIFIHGCYWHRHENCQLVSIPKQNKEFWRKKFNVNINRDGVVYFKLKCLGWRTAIIWECAIRDKGNLSGYIQTLVAWLRSEREYIEIPETVAEVDLLK